MDQVAIKKLNTPLTQEDVLSLRAGDIVSLSGTIYTGRDAAHKRLVNTLKKGDPMPIDLTGQLIYYAGPCPAKPGHPIGSVGPTTSAKMDPYTPLLLEYGLRGMIGKGPRAKQVVEAMKQYGAVYFAAVGGAGALIAECVKSAEIVLYEDLGPEAIYKLGIEDLVCVVAIDTYGNNQYEIGKSEYSIHDEEDSE